MLSNFLFIKYSYEQSLLLLLKNLILFPYTFFSVIAVENVLLLIIKIITVFTHIKKFTFSLRNLFDKFMKKR